MIYLSSFWKYSTFSLCSNQSTNKMATNDGQIKLTIQDVYTIFQCEYCKCNKHFHAGCATDTYI